MSGTRVVAELFTPLCRFRIGQDCHRVKYGECLKSGLSIRQIRFDVRWIRCLKIAIWARERLYLGVDPLTTSQH
jgi:hypothetical protein